MTEKIRAVSMYRYRGGAAEKRLYGGQGTVTEFWVYFGDEKEPVKMMGHGATPGQRKTDAVERAKALRGKTMTSNPPTLTPSQSKRRVAELRARGCEVKRVKLPSGETAVLKKCGDEKEFVNALREFMGKEPLRVNPNGNNALVWFALGTLAVAGGLLWYVTHPSEAKAAALPALPPKSSCPTAAQVKAFAEAKAKATGSFQWSDPLPTSASTWPPPKATWPSGARAYSVPDCAFYKWQLHEGAPSAWVKDAALTAELTAWTKTHAVAGHPISMFLP